MSLFELEATQQDCSTTSPHHYAPTLDEVLNRPAAWEYFSTLDKGSGLWNIGIHPESVPLLTLNTPDGQYSYHCLPFGLNSSHKIFSNVQLMKRFVMLSKTTILFVIKVKFYKIEGTREGLNV